MTNQASDALGTSVFSLRQHVGSAARVINDAVRFEQGGHHHHSHCASVDDTLQVVDVESADAEDRETDFCMNSLNIGKPNRRVVGFCGRSEDWPEPDVIGPFALSRHRLLKAVSGFPNPQMAARFL